MARQSPRNHWSIGDLLDDFHYWKRAGHPKNAKAVASRNFYLAKIGVRSSREIDILARQQIEASNDSWRVCHSAR